jgi:integrase
LSRSQKRRQRQLTHPIGERLAIKLPPLASDLLGDAKWLGGSQLNLTRYVQAAKTWLAALPGHLGIKSSSLREALLFHLLEQTRGDLGLVKVITNRTSLNFTNIIHYAAYPADRASEHWAQALTRLLGTEIAAGLSAAADPSRMPYVGTPDAIDKEALRAELDRLRERLRRCLASSPSDGSAMPAIRAHNLLTLYTLLWLNLATAGRARVSPAPLAIIGDVALVADKHRSDGSAERLVPLTAGVLAQLRAYFAYVWHLAFRIPELRPILDAFSTGVIQFQFLKADGQVIGYRPKWLYEEEHLVPMPGNWARKLVRQELTGIGGRYLDAGMGHWVAGRHPYRVTSNFAFRGFCDRWLAGEQRLERELGFEVIAHPQVQDAPIGWPVAAGLRPLKRSDLARERKDAELEPGFEFEAECRRVDEVLYEGICEASDKDPKAVAALVDRMARSHGGSKEEVRKFVRACCDAARQAWRVPVFADAPRYQFQHDWLIDQEALYNLGYFTDRVLPAFHADLEHLPAVADPASADAVDLGRFAMLCIWRQGLVTWPVLDAFLKSYCTGGILATGQLRYVPTRVRCRRNGAVMDRVNYLEPYCQAYLVVEHARIKAALVPLLELNPQQRRARMQRALEAYLRTLVHLEIGNLLTITLSAAQQYHLIHGSPVLAAYASAEFETHDLPDEEIRLLAGYDARSTPGPTLGMPGSLEQTVREAPVRLPSAELKSNQDVVHQIAYRGSALVGEMCRQIERQKLRLPLQQLLQRFAIWYLRHEAKTHHERIKPADKRQFQHVVEVVGYALIGFGIGADEGLTIDEAFLVNLEEQFRDMHADIDPSAPFQVFRRFLRQRAGRSAAEKAGFTIGEVDPPAPRGVLTKIVPTACIRAVEDSIERVDQSGIGSRSVRTVARRHLGFVATFGLRRTEAEYIREMDMQGDLIRVQPYGEHTLKTSWSERVLPAALAGSAGLGWIETASDRSERQLLAHGIPQAVNGHNFYDAVNKLVQRKASDPGVHLHTVRHSVASRMLLSALSESVDYGEIVSQFPWLAEFMSGSTEMEVMSGGEGQSGHGLQAIAALMGHSHPLTTLRHYIHTAGIAFYAHLCGRPVPNLTRAFEFRLGSSRTMQRRIQAWRVATKDMEPAADEAFLHQNVRAEAELLCPNVVNVEEETRTEAPGDEADHQLAPESPGYDPQAISYERLARVEEVLRGESPNDIGLDVARVEEALRTVYEIQTGKRGNDSKRHPPVELDRKWLPKQPAAKSPTLAAAVLCAWIEQLRIRDAGLLDWLLKRWLHDSEKEFGRIRVAAKEDARWEEFSSTPTVALVKERKVFKRKPGSGRRDRVQRWRRIRCRDPAGSIIRRDVQAVRWVMTWTFALRAISE